MGNSRERWIFSPEKPSAEASAVKPPSFSAGTGFEVRADFAERADFLSTNCPNYTDYFFNRNEIKGNKGLILRQI